MTTQVIKPGYKQSQFGLIPADWEIKNLGEICELITKGTTPPRFTDSGINFIKTENFIGENIDKEQLSFIDETTHNTILKRSILKENDILFSIAGAIGKLVVVTKDILPANTNQALSIIRLKNNSNIKYVKFTLESNYMKKYTNLCVKWGGQPNLNLQQVSDFSFLLPPLPEQEIIAKILGEVDETIEKTQNMIDKLELRNKGLEQKLLTGKVRLKGFSGEFKKLSADKIFKSVSIKNLPNEELLSATQEQGIIPRSMLEGRVTMPTSEAKSYKLVVPGNFVISLRSFQGGLEYSKYRGIVSPAYTVLDHILAICDDYYKYYFKSYDFIGHLSVAVIGIRDGKQISFDDFCTLDLPYPEPEEQKAIANVLNKATEQLNLYEQKLEKLQELKKGLMQQLLTGKVRVKEFSN